MCFLLLWFFVVFFLTNFWLVCGGPKPLCWSFSGGARASSCTTGTTCTKEYYCRWALVPHCYWIKPNGWVMLNYAQCIHRWSRAYVGSLSSSQSDLFQLLEVVSHPSQGRFPQQIAYRYFAAN